MAAVAQLIKIHAGGILDGILIAVGHIRQIKGKAFVCAAIIITIHLRLRNILAIFFDLNTFFTVKSQCRSDNHIRKMDVFRSAPGCDCHCIMDLIVFRVISAGLLYTGVMGIVQIDGLVQTCSEVDGVDFAVE